MKNKIFAINSYEELFNLKKENLLFLAQKEQGFYYLIDKKNKNGFALISNKYLDAYLPAKLYLFTSHCSINSFVIGQEEQNVEIKNYDYLKNIEFISKKDFLLELKNFKCTDIIKSEIQALIDNNAINKNLKTKAKTKKLKI